jgi:hypothetical protein
MRYQQCIVLHFTVSVKIVAMQNVLMESTRQRACRPAGKHRLFPAMWHTLRHEVLRGVRIAYTRCDKVRVAISRHRGMRCGISELAYLFSELSAAAAS